MHEINIIIEYCTQTNLINKDQRTRIKSIKTTNYSYNEKPTTTSCNNLTVFCYTHILFFSLLFG